MVHFSEGAHVFFNLRIRDGVKVRVVGASGWDCKYLQMLKLVEVFSTVVRVKPGCECVTRGGSRGSNMCREWNGWTRREALVLFAWAHACRNCDVPMPSQRQ